MNFEPGCRVVVAGYEHNLHLGAHAVEHGKRLDHKLLRLDGGQWRMVHVAAHQQRVGPLALQYFAELM